MAFSVYSEVFKRAELGKVLLDTIVKDLKKSTHIDLEKDSYSEIRDVVNNNLAPPPEFSRADGRGDTHTS